MMKNSLLSVCSVHQQGAGLLTSLGHMLHFSVIQQEREREREKQVSDEEEEEEEGEQQTVRHQCQAFDSVSRGCVCVCGGGCHAVWFISPPSVCCVRGWGGAGRGVWASRVKATLGLKEEGRRCCGLAAEINNNMLVSCFSPAFISKWSSSSHRETCTLIRHETASSPIIPCDSYKLS